MRCALCAKASWHFLIPTSSALLIHARTSTQMERFARAYREAGAEAVEGFRRVLIGIVEPEDRARVRPAAIRAQNRR